MTKTGRLFIKTANYKQLQKQKKSESFVNSSNWIILIKNKDLIMIYSKHKSFFAQIIKSILMIDG